MSIYWDKRGNQYRCHGSETVDKLKLLEGFEEKSLEDLKLRKGDNYEIGNSIFELLTEFISIDRKNGGVRAIVENIDYYITDLEIIENKLYDERNEMFDTQKIRISNIGKGDTLNAIQRLAISDSLEKPMDERELKETLEEIDERIPSLTGILTLLKCIKQWLTPLTEEEKTAHLINNNKDVEKLNKDAEKLLLNEVRRKIEEEQVRRKIEEEQVRRKIEEEQPRKHLRSKTTRRNS